MKRIISILLVLLLTTGCAGTAASIPSTTVTDAQTEPTETTEPVFDPYKIVHEMTTEELVGQIFLARCPSNETATEHLKEYHLGGYILFGRDFEDQNSASINATIRSYNQAAEIPPLIAVDEEGGTVTRVSGNDAFREQRFPSPRSLYAEGGIELLCSTEAEKCQLLASLGINVNLAPVCDITTDHSAFMYDRSLGLDPQTTSQCISAMVQTMNEQHIGSALKHFPGYGNNTDTHTGVAVDTRSLESLQQNDFLPFQAGINSGCGAILVSHTIVNCLDDTMPASLSANVIGYLRTEMGFNGVVITDDLVMEAITDQYGTGESAVLAVLAGNDLLCSSEYAEQYSAVLESANSGRIPMERLREAAARVIQWKYDLGLIPTAF